MKIVNTTPHDIIVFMPDGGSRVYHPEMVLRLEEVNYDQGYIDDIPLKRKEFFLPENLPAYEPDVYYIVSSVLKGFVPYRRDFLAPTEMVRNEYGDVVGIKALYS